MEVTWAPSVPPHPLPMHPALLGGRTSGCCWPRGCPCAQEAQGAVPALGGHALGMAETTWEWRWHEITEEVIHIQRNFFSLPLKLLKETMKNNPLVHDGNELLCESAAMGAGTCQPTSIPLKNLNLLVPAPCVWHVASLTS